MRRIACTSRSRRALVCVYIALAGSCAHATARGGDVPIDLQQTLAAAMHESAAAWNRADLDGFLATYKHDAQTAFMGPQITYGVPEIRSRYERSYFRQDSPRSELTYGDLKFRRLGPDYVLMTGRWYLSYPDGKKQEGYYSLVWERTAAGWKIVHDHSS